MTGLRFRSNMLMPWAIALSLLVALAAAPLATLAQDASPAAGGELQPYEPSEGADSLSGEVEVDGSSTVGPVTEAVAEEFRNVAGDVEVTVNISGTGGGFERFCADETDINDASRAIVDDEIAACEEAGVDYYRFQVAVDGLAFTVNPENDFVDCLTVEQLADVWVEGSEITSWDQVDSSFPAEPIELFGPDPDSGTYDYFVEVVEDTTGSEAGPRSDYTASVDDNVLVEGVAGSENALGYFGYAYYEQNQDRLKVLEIDGGEGCVEPTAETVASGEYSPLARPLYIYVKASSMEDPAVQEFVRFYIANAPELATDVGYFPATDAEYIDAQQKVEAAISGEGTPDSAA